MIDYNLIDDVNNLTLEIINKSSIGRFFEKDFTLLDKSNADKLFNEKILSISRKVPIKIDYFYNSSWFFIKLEKKINHISIDFNMEPLADIKLTYNLKSKKTRLNRRIVDIDTIIEIINNYYEDNKTIFFNDIIEHYDVNYSNSISKIENEKDLFDHIKILKIKKY